MEDIIIFDGECNFCNYYVNRLISLDRQKHFLFTPYESELSQGILSDAGFSLEFRESFILYTENNVFIKSDAIIKIFTKVGGIWKMMAWFIQYLIPKFIRDWSYDIVAKNRYVISRNFDTCQIPSPEVKSRFR